MPTTMATDPPTAQPEPDTTTVMPDMATTTMPDMVTEPADDRFEGENDSVVLDPFY